MSYECVRGRSLLWGSWRSPARLSAVRVGRTLAFSPCVMRALLAFAAGALIAGIWPTSPSGAFADSGVRLQGAFLTATSHAAPQVVDPLSCKKRVGTADPNACNLNWSPKADGDPCPLPGCLGCYTGPDGMSYGPCKGPCRSTTATIYKAVDSSTSSQCYKQLPCDNASIAATFRTYPCGLNTAPNPACVCSIITGAGANSCGTPQSCAQGFAFVSCSCP